MRGWPLAGAAVLALGCATAGPTGDWRPGMATGPVVIIEGEAPAALVPPPAPTGAFALTREEFYDVRGTTAAEILASMQRNGPGAGEARLPGAHVWDIEWSMPRFGGGADCEVPRARVGVQSTITMPRWVDRPKADPDLVSEWDLFLTALWVHEYGHRGVAYAAAAEVRRVLDRFRGQPCDVFRAVNDAVASAEARYRTRDREYDAETVAGYRQGVIWPPR